MRKILIYDLPTRLFHWIFASLFVAAFFIAKNVDDDNPLFSYHMLAGLMLGGLVVLRLVWGIVGTRYARFSSFALHPADLLDYFKGIFTGSKKRWSGHNPASSWGTLAMLGLGLLLAITGFLMASGSKETFEDIHELLANAFLITVLLHVAGVLLHAFRHKDGIAFTMAHGKKEESSEAAGIENSHPVTALLLVGLMTIFGGYLYLQYDSTARELKLFGKTLALGEVEDENKAADHQETGKGDGDENESDDDD